MVTNFLSVAELIINLFYDLGLRLEEAEEDYLIDEIIAILEDNI